MNQTTKRPPGRPKKTEDAPVMERQTKKPIKRQEKLLDVLEYTANNSGAVLMLMQSGITVYDEESGKVREIRYCENENSIWKDPSHLPYG